MAQAKRDTRLESRTNRLKLSIGTRHWVSTGDDCSLGYRRTSEGFGMWQGRIRIEGQYQFATFGEADDFRDADGIKTLNYFQAYDKARQWSASLRQERLNPNAHAQKTLTLRKAAENYLAWFKDHRKAYRETYLNVHAHILPTFGDMLVSELKTAAIKAWLNKLAATPARKRTGMGAKRWLSVQHQSQRMKNAPVNPLLIVL